MTNHGRHRGGLFVGILITAIGVIFLLDQMEIVHAAWVFEVFWPVILIGLGVGLLFRTNDNQGTAMPNTSDVPEDLSRARRMTISFWGPLLILIGVVSLLGNLTHIRGALGPLVLILIGAWFILKRSSYDDIWRGQRHGMAMREWWQHHGRYKDGTPPPTYPPSPGTGTGPNPTAAGFADQGTGGQERWANERQQAPTNPPPPGVPGASADASANAPPPPAGTGASFSPDDVFEHSIAFMAFKRRITTQHFRYAKLSAVFGGFHLDFTMADMDSNQAVMYIDAVFGGGEIRIPPSWRVSIDAHAFGGAFMDETYGRPDVTATAKTLIIRGSTVFGGVVIKN